MKGIRHMIQTKGNDRAKGIFRLLFLSCLAFLFALAQAGGSAQAAGVELYTSYPGIKVSPGEAVSFTIDVVNNSAAMQKVNLTVVKAPQGWKTQIEGGSWIIHDVLVKGKETQSVQLTTTVPTEAKEGTYELLLRGQTAGGETSTLSLSVEVTKQGGTATQSELVAQYPVLQGPSSASFQFRVDLKNRTGEKQLYALSADAPRGWDVQFKPSYGDKTIASISLDANGSESLDVTITPPKNVKAGSYKIPIYAVSPKNKVSTELEVKITGTYELEVTTKTGRLNVEATAGKAGKITLLVNNKGSADVKGIELSADVPPNWEMTFEPKTIDVLKAGESREIVATLKPSDDAIAGDYVASVSATAPEASATADLRVAVETSILWGWIGVLIVIAVFAGLFHLFRKYGRR
ncbi:NEW3 domain-containing protein [Bacillaceae bacterium]